MDALGKVKQAFPICKGLEKNPTETTMEVKEISGLLVELWNGMVNGRFWFPQKMVGGI